jgi:MFS family permease
MSFRFISNHSLFTFLKNLRGNPRACIYTEPLWGIPFNLYIQYASIYMLALGLSESEIGLIPSIGGILQIVFALFSGVVTDKIGRRRTTLIADILCWSIPALLSALAQNFWYFLAAAIFNSIWRISQNSWTCLLVEDAEPTQLVDIYTWIYIANLLVGLIAPVTGALIAIFEFVPTMRGLYAFAAVMFTLKAVITYWYTDETAQGKVRMQETREQSIFYVLRGYRGVFSELLHTPQTLFTAGIMFVISVTMLINGYFWAIFVTEKLHVPVEYIAVSPFIKSAVMLLFFFFVMPRLNKLHFKLPMAVGFLVYGISQVVLITAPIQGYAALVCSIVLDACCVAAVNPLVDQLAVLAIRAEERARIQAILQMSIILFTSPFGWIAGTLLELNKNLPFMLNIVLFCVGAVLAYHVGTRMQPAAETDAVSPAV